DGEMRIYITGDTLYNEEIFKDLRQPIDVLFLPINGVGNNMNKADAARFARKVGAAKVVPLHWGMFDELTPDDFDSDQTVIPKLYEIINL
ncbi:MAG: MBL fold metallo-hydrolase, partial [Clostridia bacterium]|nr:MBL fold metallo-hydrolase [Clostridia bacterium]